MSMIVPYGITPDELVERTSMSTRRGVPRLEPTALSRWVVGAGLAEQRGGMLRPTTRGRVRACIEL